MVQVPVKLDVETVARLDLLRGSYPFKPGRSTVIRELVEEGLRLIAEGIMQFRAQAINRVPSVQGGQGIPGIPEEFPGQVETSKNMPGSMKPLRRAEPTPRNGASRRRDTTHFNRKYEANQASRITPFRQIQHIHFTPLNQEVA